MYIFWASIVYKKQISMYGIENCVHLFQFQLNSSVESGRACSGRSLQLLSNLTLGENLSHPAFREDEGLTEVSWEALNQGKLIHRE